MNVFRLHIRPNGGIADSAFSFAYCLDEQVLGVGWQTYSDSVALSWEEYLKEAIVHHDDGDLSRVRYLKRNVKKDDLIWTRSPTGIYYLAKVKSEWEYFTNARAEDADVVNVVRCEILKVGSIDEVPGKVVNCFRAQRAIQAIDNEPVRLYSQHLWNALSGTQYYAARDLPADSLFSFLTPEQTEDVIFIYLQTLGWLVIPHSRKADTMSFEFYLIHRETKERAIVQIKTGNTQLTVNEWADRAQRVYLFQSSGLYAGEAQPSVTCLLPSDIRLFMDSHADILPANITHWLARCGVTSQACEPSVSTAIAAVTATL